MGNDKIPLGVRMAAGFLRAVAFVWFLWAAFLAVNFVLAGFYSLFKADQPPWGVPLICGLALLLLGIGRTMTVFAASLLDMHGTGPSEASRYSVRRRWLKFAQEAVTTIWIAGLILTAATLGRTIADLLRSQPPGISVLTAAGSAAIALGAWLGRRHFCLRRSISTAGHP